MFNEILTTLDGSEYGERALAYTRDLAKIAGARVTLLSVIEPTPSPVEVVQAEPDEHRGRPWLAYLERKASELREAGLGEVEAAVRFGDPARLITEAARSLRADLIIMSTQGLGADGNYALGSVALKVLMTAPCPIFMVRINKPEPARTPAEERWQAEGGANIA